MEDGGGRHEGQWTVGGEVGRLPTFGGGPGACYHVVGATGTRKQLDFGCDVKRGFWESSIPAHAHNFRGVRCWYGLWIEVAGEDKFGGIELLQVGTSGLGSDRGSCLCNDMLDAGAHERGDGLRKWVDSHWSHWSVME